MARMKKGQKGHEEAVNKWRQSMIKKYGSKEAVHEILSKQGAKGGASSSLGGFASNPELARIAGAKGGRISRRGEGNWTKKIEDRREHVIAMLDMGVSKAEIARRIGVDYPAFVYWAKTRVGGKNV